ncbi:MAG: heterodisulfide reductase-related iron-sulfur binding cluster [Bryobacterales bacterium]|nr:heterodisulfide reductase-related iron-sulfur binding cluster [Bryobacterales bacterium]
MAVAEIARAEAPKLFDLDRCVHCGLCLNACPTYRELGLEADSPRGRVYQMVQVAEQRTTLTPSYVEHIGLCLACRACETACPSGVQYGRLVEAARAQIETHVKRGILVRLLRRLVFDLLLPSPVALRIAGALLYLYEMSGLRRLVRFAGLLKPFGNLDRIERLTPRVEVPFFFSRLGEVFPPEGERRYRVAFVAGCIANVCFARLNEATVRVLQKNGCEVTVPDDQGCCGALHVHSGLRDKARQLARKNIDVFLKGDYDAIITNAAGCGSTLKEYHELLAGDAEYAGPAQRFVKLVRDVSEFLASIELNPNLGPVPVTATYQDSCHLAHGQRIRIPPRKLLAAIPELKFRELPLADLCCGSAGVYNIVHNDLAMSLLEKKMQRVAETGADVILTANPGCLLQLRAGAAMFGRGERVAHVVEILDESYRAWRA